MDEIMIQMIEIYQPNGIDWMNYKQSIKNPYMYRYIKSCRDGGRKTIKNGAILTVDSNWELNVLDNRYNKLYKELNGLFLELNRTQMPPAEDYFEEVDRVLKRVRR